ncbi:MAG TPA: CUAEP/CCAEP-tail radical SAM protein [Vicinamibacterales bacterium]
MKPAKVVLISTYDMGRQPFGLASPAAWLRAAGCDVECVDVSREALDDDRIRHGEVIGFYLPMHTATRLALPIVARVRRMNPAARICAYGLYAPLNREALSAAGVDAVFGGEFEDDLARWAVFAAASAPNDSARVPRIHFLTPDRSSLPPLEKYATLQLPDGRRRLVGYTEASRGCRHLCRHCPIVPIYNGQFRIVQPDVVLADVAAQVAAGAGHITFGDPDFFNGPTHAMRVVDALHAAHPHVSYDVTIKVEHLLKNRALLPRLAQTGCAFVTSAVESIDDRVLARLEKHHTRQDFIDAVSICRDAGVALVPTFVAFHPWLSLDDYCELLETIESLELETHVAPIQLAIRLLITEGSRLLELEDVRKLVRGFDAATLTYRWDHPDPRVDALQRELSEMVGLRLTADRRTAFGAVSDLAHDRAGLPRAASKPARDRATIPYLNEPWYC